MGYFYKYDTNYDDETGIWTEQIGFCSPGTCQYCDAFRKDGSPSNAFIALEKKRRD